MTMESFRPEIIRYIDHKKHNVPGGGVGLVAQV